jgi:predicted RNA binding protein YcfA (HicA-like mRNA interferase family)
MVKIYSSREIIKTLKEDGWKEVRVTGSHHHFKHPEKIGVVTIPHPKK